MRNVLPVVAGIVLVVAGLVSPLPAAAASCSFVLGFQTVASMIPTQVGTCLVDEHHNPTNGDGLQETTGVAGGSGTGLLVWRKADNWTAYTDGYHTWINGPKGLQERLNTEQFSWEAGKLPTTTNSTAAASSSSTPVQFGPKQQLSSSCHAYGNYLAAFMPYFNQQASGMDGLASSYTSGSNVVLNPYWEQAVAVYGARVEDAAQSYFQQRPSVCAEMGPIDTAATAYYSRLDDVVRTAISNLRSRLLTGVVDLNISQYGQMRPGGQQQIIYAINKVFEQYQW